MRRLRILQVVPSYIPAWRYGGPIRSVHGLSRALAARGHDVHVATTNVDGNSDAHVPINVPVNIEGVDVHYFESKRFRRLYYAPRMQDFLHTTIHGWDLIHTHSVFLWPTTAAARVARKCGKPYVLSPRGMLVPDLINRRSSLPKRAWIRLFERRNVNSAAAIHVTSAIEHQQIRALGMEPSQVWELPNGFDSPEDDSGDSSETLTPLVLPERYVLYLGRISWKKGLDRLVRAIAAVPGAELVIAGNDDENYSPTILRLAEENSISHRVHLVGYVAGARKRDVICKAVVMALASYSENFGNAVLEAMALGVPVVLTPEVGLAAEVESKECGIVANGDGPEFATALARMIGEPGLAERLGRNAAATANAYSWMNIAERFEERYLTLLKA